MEAFLLDDVLAQLRAALELNDLAGAVAVIESLQPADRADLFWKRWRMKMQPRWQSFCL